MFALHYNKIGIFIVHCTTVVIIITTTYNEVYS